MPVLLSFSSVLLAFFLFLHKDHRLFLLWLPAINCNQPLCRRGEIERPPLFHPSPIFHSFFHSLIAERRAAAVIFLWCFVDAFSDAVKPRETRAAVPFTSWMRYEKKRWVNMEVSWGERGKQRFAELRLSLLEERVRMHLKSVSTKSFDASVESSLGANRLLVL